MHFIIYLDDMTRLTEGWDFIAMKFKSKRNIAIVAGGDTSEIMLRSAQGIYSFIDKEV